jgi:ubiquinone biosynthesis protein
MAVVRGRGLRTSVMLNREAAPMFPMVRAYERKGAMTAGRLITCAMMLGLSFAGSPPVSAEPTLTLPTPRSHYETFTPGISGLPLLQNLVQGLDPQTQKTVLAFVASSHVLNAGSMADPSSPGANALLNMAHAAGISDQTTLSKGQALARLNEMNWRPSKPSLLEFVVHQSQVFGMIPVKFQPFLYPIVHDSLLYFLDHLPEDRLLEKLVDIAYLPAGSSRNADLLAFVAKTPSLQKMGQILARNKALSPEYQEALQQLENGIHTMTRDELVQFIADDMGKSNIDNNRVEFAENILAEGSVGAVIRATWIPSGSHDRREAICKVIKPYVLIHLPQELEIIDGLAGYFTDTHDFYQLGTMPLVEMFQEVKKALTKEIQVVDEQQNLVRARQYYMNNKNIVVPELYPISTSHVTFMQYISGEKITSAFEGQPAQRAIMARRLADVMTRDVIFASTREPIFHGDPHAGNVFHVTGNPDDPYQIALLDWGLYGTFPREDRIALMQLILGVQLRDAKRLHDNVGGMLANGMPDDPEKVRQIDATIARVLQPKERRTAFDALEELLVDLIDAGYATRFSLNLFIKSRITMGGILTELDPALDQDRYLSQRVRSLVKREIPKRLLYTIWFPAWNSRSYRSLLSNGDVLAARKIPKKPQ